MIDSRDFIAARELRRRSRCRPGPKVALTGGLDFQQPPSDLGSSRQWRAKGAELIASKWTTTRKVSQIAFKPDWTKHAKAAPFKRNDPMLELLPIGVMHFPGTGIRDNLADKAKRFGIPVWRFGST